jgi:8-oxo-dGTP pyrophosphatase MutT (NUDIX family)
MDQAAEPAEIIRAAGIVLRAPDGKVLMLNRTDGEGWAWPGGGIKEGESAEQAAYRETFEETGRRLGSVGQFLMRRVKDGVDFATFIADVDAPFVPQLNHEHSAFAWLDPTEA